MRQRQPSPQAQGMSFSTTIVMYAIKTIRHAIGSSSPRRLSRAAKYTRQSRVDRSVSCHGQERLVNRQNYTREIVNQSSDLTAVSGPSPAPLEERQLSFMALQRHDYPPGTDYRRRSECPYFPTMYCDYIHVLFQLTITVMFDRNY